MAAENCLDCRPPIDNDRRSERTQSDARRLKGEKVMTYARKLAVVLLFAVSLIAGWMAAPAAAQDYPNKPVTLIVPYPPGGATDAISRIVQEAMTQSLGQQIVIENIGGAGGMIAAAKAARSTPD